MAIRDILGGVTGDIVAGARGAMQGMTAVTAKKKTEDASRILAGYMQALQAGDDAGIQSSYDSAIASGNLSADQIEKMGTLHRAHSDRTEARGIREAGRKRAEADRTFAKEGQDYNREQTRKADLTKRIADARNNGNFSLAQQLMQERDGVNYNAATQIPLSEQRQKDYAANQAIIGRKAKLDELTVANLEFEQTNRGKREDDALKKEINDKWILSREKAIKELQGVSTNWDKENEVWRIPDSEVETKIRNKWEAYFKSGYGDHFGADAIKKHLPQLDYDAIGTVPPPAAASRAIGSYDFEGDGSESPPIAGRTDPSWQGFPHPLPEVSSQDQALPETQTVQPPGQIDPRVAERFQSDPNAFVDRLRRDAAGAVPPITIEQYISNLPTTPETRAEISALAGGGATIQPASPDTTAAIQPTIQPASPDTTAAIQPTIQPDRAAMIEEMIRLKAQMQQTGESDFSFEFRLNELQSQTGIEWRLDNEELRRRAAGTTTTAETGREMPVRGVDQPDPTLMGLGSPREAVGNVAQRASSAVDEFSAAQHSGQEANLEKMIGDLLTRLEGSDSRGKANIQRQLGQLMGQYPEIYARAVAGRQQTNQPQVL